MFKLLKGLEQPGQGEASLHQLGKTVFWSFFGVRKRHHLDQDAASITPKQLVIAGFIGTVLFVVAMATLVHLILK